MIFFLRHFFYFNTILGLAHSASLSTHTTLQPTATLLPSTSVSPQIHTIAVGSGGFKFTPDSIRADVGDIVTFEFYPPDHAIARAEYMSPCFPYEYTGKGKVGFWSGFHLVKTVNELTYFNITIDDEAPIFFYCAAPDSCTVEGMVGVINQNETQTLEVQKLFAKNSTLMLAPGEEVPSEASSTSSATLSSVPKDASSNFPKGSTTANNHKSLSAGVIVAISVGTALFLAICAGLCFCIRRRKILKEFWGQIKSFKEYRDNSAEHRAELPASCLEHQQYSRPQQAAELWSPVEPSVLTSPHPVK